MLIAKIYVNETQIDEIHIQNMVDRNKKGETLYKVREPQGFENLKLWHKRDLGYQPLLKKVLKII